MDFKQNDKYRKYLERLRNNPHNSVYAHKVRKYAPLTGGSGTSNTHKLIDKINNMLANVGQKGGEITQEMHEHNMSEVAKFEKASKMLSENKSETVTKLTHEIEELKDQLDENGKAKEQLELFYTEYQTQVQKVLNAFDIPDSKDEKQNT
jgi:hypothetical protein